MQCRRTLGVALVVANRKWRAQRQRLTSLLVSSPQTFRPSQHTPKLSLCLTKHCPMETYAAVGVSGQLHVPAAVVPGTHRIGGWVGPIAGVDWNADLAAVQPAANTAHAGMWSLLLPPEAGNLCCCPGTFLSGFDCYCCKKSGRVGAVILAPSPSGRAGESERATGSGSCLDERNCHAPSLQGVTVTATIAGNMPQATAGRDMTPCSLVRIHNYCEIAVTTHRLPHPEAGISSKSRI
jgi:hypothetical protein